MAGPHDTYFKAIFSDPEVASAHLRSQVPADARDAIDWSSLDLAPGSFVDKELRERHSDLLFSVSLADGAPGLLYIVFEHQSSHDPLMALRLHRYIQHVWDRWTRENPDAVAIPAIISSLLIQGPRPWRGPTRLQDCVAIPPQLDSLRPYIPDVRTVVLELARIPDDALPGDPVGRLGLAMLKHSRGPDRWRALLRHEHLLAALPPHKNARAIRASLHYLLRVSPDGPGPEVLTMLRQQTSPTLVDDEMSEWDLWRLNELRRMVGRQLVWRFGEAADSLVPFVERASRPMLDDIAKAVVQSADLDEITEILNNV